MSRWVRNWWTIGDCSGHDRICAQYRGNSTMRVWSLLGLLGLPSGIAAAQQPGRVYRIGYTQIVDHPALNATRQGFLDGLRAAGFVEGRNLVFEYQNAQGD